MKKLLILSILFLLFIISSCSGGSDDPIMDPPPNNNTDVTYAGTVKSIIDGSCIGCHSDPPTNNAPMSLITYQNVRDAVMSRNLIARVENGSMPPQGADLTAAQVQSIKDWQSGGFKQ